MYVWSICFEKVDGATQGRISINLSKSKLYLNNKAFMILLESLTWQLKFNTNPSKSKLAFLVRVVVLHFLIFFYFLNSYSIYKIVKQLTVSIAFCISGIVLQRDHTSKPGGNLGNPLQQAVDNLGMESFVSHMSLGVLLFSPWPPFGYILHSGSFFQFRAFFKVTLGFVVNTLPLTALVCATYFLSCDHVIHCNI